MNGIVHNKGLMTIASTQGSISPSGPPTVKVQARGGWETQTTSNQNNVKWGSPGEHKECKLKGDTTDG